MESPGWSIYVVTVEDTDTNERNYSSKANATPNDESIVLLSSVDFESGFGDWVNITGGDSHDWTRNSGSTQSPQTRPDSGANGSTWYAYLETSTASNAGDTAILESPIINGFGRALTFYYHMFGADIIDTNDLPEFMGDWLLADCGLNLNGNCLINLFEFAELVENWVDNSFQ